MRTEVIEVLSTLPGAVVTKVTSEEGRVRIIALSDTKTFAIVLEGCQWDDRRCEKCSCDPDAVRLIVEAL